MPIDLGPRSNGEYRAPPPTEFEREVVRRTRDAIDTNARRTGVGRRDFLRSACAMATMLLVVDGCAKEKAAQHGKRPGGDFASTLPPESTTEPSAATTVLRDDRAF